jgi:hypothetical protein
MQYDHTLTVELTLFFFTNHPLPYQAISGDAARWSPKKRCCTDHMQGRVSPQGEDIGGSQS